MILRNMLEDVRAFHKAFSHPVAERPMPLTYSRARARAGWMAEESFELENDSLHMGGKVAAGEADEAELIAVQVDASIDSMYFAIGNIVELGIDPEPIWAIVQEANMAKLHDGVAVYYPEGHPKAGKVKKPDDWEDPGPKIVAEIRRQIAEAGRTKGQ